MQLFYLLFFGNNSNNDEDADNTDDNESLVTPESLDRVDILSMDKSEEFGSVWVKDKKIVHNVVNDEVKDFVESRKRSWEKGTHEYESGGMFESSSSKTSIGRSDFINIIFIDLSDKFSGEYEIDLVNAGE